MTDLAIPKALNSIAAMMRMEGYRPDACGVEALVLDNAADEIERLRAIITDLRSRPSQHLTELINTRTDCEFLKMENARLRHGNAKAMEAL